MKKMMLAMILVMLVMSLMPATAGATEAPSTADMLESPTDGMLAWFESYVEDADETCEPLPTDYLTETGLDYFRALGWQGIAGDDQEALYHPECL